MPPAQPGARSPASTDLAKPGVKVALCQPQVPCGATAAKVFANAEVTVTPVTLEPDVKSVLSKVELGEVDAASSTSPTCRPPGDKVKGVEIPADVNASTSYPIAALTKSANAATAAGVRRLRAVPGRAQRADRGRLPAAVTDRR